MNTIKKLISLMLMVMLLSLSTSAVFADGTDSILTINSYEEWLSEQVQIADANMKSEIVNELNKFRNLSKNDQQKIVNLLNNPEAFKKEIINALASKPVMNLESLNIEPGFSTRSMGDEIRRKTKGTYTVEVSGVEIVELSAWVVYDCYDGTYIIGEPIAGNIHVVKNLNPALTLDTSLTSLYTMNNKACADVDITLGIGLEIGDTNLAGVNVVFEATSWGSHRFTITDW